MLSAQAQFLGDTGDAEGLTRESGAKDIMRGDVAVIEQGGRVLEVDVLGFGDVPIGGHAVIRRIGVPGLLVPVRRPDAIGAGCLKCIVETSDTAEEIDEGGLIPRA